MRLQKHRALWVSFVIGFGTFLLVVVLWRLGYFQIAELWIYDHEVAWRAGPGIADPRIVLVSMEETDIRKYDYPLRDAKMAELLETIERGGARAIGLDLYRDLPEPRNGTELGKLNRVLNQYPNIICIFRFGTESKPFDIPPPAVLSGSLDRIGFNDLSFDYRTIRRGFLYLPNSFQFSSLTWQLALLYLQPLGIVPGSGGTDGSVALGKARFTRFRAYDGGYTNAIDGGFQFLIDFRGPRQLMTFSVDQVLTASSLAAFKDKIVLIGSQAETTNDTRGTPIDQLESGLMIHAQCVNQFLRAALDGDQPTYSWSVPAEAIWIFGWCILATAIGYFSPSTWTFGALLVGALAALLIAGLHAFSHGLWLLMAAPGTATLLASGAVKANAAQTEAKQRGALMRLFSQHVSNDVAKIIWERRDEYLDGNRPRAQKLMVTVLFTDLKDYSTMSERLEPDVLIQWVDECLGGLGHHVAQNGGMINKFMGDAIMAVFGAPIPRTSEDEVAKDALHAVQCALDMRKEMGRLNAKWKVRGLPEARMRIGICTGIVMGGLVGNAERLEYTTIGYTTNTAARLESLERENITPADGDGRILIAESTFLLIKSRFSTESMGEIKLKGQNQTTTVYRVLAPSDSLTPSKL